MKLRLKNLDEVKKMYGYVKNCENGIKLCENIMSASDRQVFINNSMYENFGKEIEVKERKNKIEDRPEKYSYTHVHEGTWLYSISWFKDNNLFEDEDFLI